MYAAMAPLVAKPVAPINGAALRPHCTNISLALRLQLRLLAARKQTMTRQAAAF